MLSASITNSNFTSKSTQNEHICIAVFQIFPGGHTPDTWPRSRPLEWATVKCNSWPWNRRWRSLESMLPITLDAKLIRLQFCVKKADPSPTISSCPSLSCIRYILSAFPCKKYVNFDLFTFKIVINFTNFQNNKRTQWLQNEAKWAIARLNRTSCLSSNLGREENKNTYLYVRTQYIRLSRFLQTSNLFGWQEPYSWVSSG